MTKTIQDILNEFIGDGELHPSHFECEDTEFCHTFKARQNFRAQLRQKLPQTIKEIEALVEGVKPEEIDSDDYDEYQKERN